MLDQFVVILAEVEAVVNMRPLAYVYDDQFRFTLPLANFFNINPLRTKLIYELRFYAFK